MAGRPAPMIALAATERAFAASARHVALRRDGQAAYDLRPETRCVPPPSTEARKSAREILIERPTRLRDAGDDELVREVEQA